MTRDDGRPEASRADGVVEGGAASPAGPDPLEAMRADRIHRWPIVVFSLMAFTFAGMLVAQMLGAEHTVTVYERRTWRPTPSASTRRGFGRSAASARR